jgi:pyruvate,water dikinase
MFLVAQKTVYWFAEIDRSSLAIAGGKGANLGEMTKAGFPVPPGFCVSADAYFQFIKENGIDEIIRTKLAGLNVEDNNTLQPASVAVKDAILGGRIPQSIRDEIISAYEKLCDSPDTDGIHTIGKEVLVAVRSSATAEDLPEASFAGQQATYLNIRGDAGVVDAVRRCWASLFEARAIYYRQTNNFDHLKVGLSAVVQRMIESESSGVMFTADPFTGDVGKIVIEAGWGLGEAIVSGMITPDHFVVNKADLSLEEKQIHKQDKMIVLSGDGDAELDVPEELAERQKLSDEHVMELAAIGRHIEDHYHAPQDIEWALEKGKLYIVQSRAITTLKKESNTRGETAMATSPTTSEKKVLLRGAGASPGIASGPVRIIADASELDRVKQGDVLVTRMTSPDYVPGMKRAIAILTDEGGATCHAAIVSRELGVPCIVGTGNATKVLHDDQIVTVDAKRGVAYEGVVDLGEAGKAAAAGAAGQSGGFGGGAVITGTRIYVNLAEPELAEKVAAHDVDGVGLLRAEFMIAGIGIHPKKMIKEGRQQEFIDKIAEGLRQVCSAFDNRPVIYRATDFKTNEYRNLEGGAEFEPHEENPMIGYRGCLRYIHDPEVFNLELEAIKKVRNEYGMKNINLMIPVVRTIGEFKQVKALVEASGLKPGLDFKLGIMCEVPSTVILAKEFCTAGAQFFSIGSNDLTQLTLGLDRDNAVIAEEFDERDPAIYKSLEKVIRECHENGVTVGICGQAPSVYPEFAEKLIEFGIDSISVNPDVIEATRKRVASVEMRLLLKKAREK